MADKARASGTRIERGLRGRRVVVVTCDAGDIHATKDATGEPFHIAHPWGDERFFGTVPQVEIRIAELIHRHTDPGGRRQET